MLSFQNNEYDDLVKLDKLYQDVKSIILYSEEIDPTSSCNLQIIKELRDAFDHLMTVIHSHLVDQTIETDEINSRSNIDKAIGHVYRAGFDACDGTIISLKDLIEREFNKYHYDVIMEVIKDYWDIRKSIHQVIANVSMHRSKKDIGEASDEALSAYIEDMGILGDIYAKLLEYGPALEECKRRLRRKNAWQIVEKFIYLVLGAILGTIFSMLFTGS